MASVVNAKLVIPVLACMLVVSPASSGYCPPDPRSAKDRLVFQGRMLGVLADEAYGTVGNHLYRWRTNLESLAVRSFWAMFGFLYSSSQATDDRLESKKTLEFLALQLAGIPPYVVSHPDGTMFCHSKIAEAAKRLLEGVAVCRTVRKLDPSFCEPLSVLGEDKRECCTARASFTLMLAGKCSEEAAKNLARGMNISPRKWLANCKVLLRRDMARCREQNKDKEGFNEICEALITTNDAPCRRIGNEELKNDCLVSVETMRLLNGRNLHKAIAHFGPVDQCMHMHLASVGATTQSVTCGELSLGLLRSEKVLTGRCASFLMPFLVQSW